MRIKAKDQTRMEHMQQLETRFEYIEISFN